MSRSCQNCSSLASLVDEQKSKIQLLESRLKNVLRAYKVACKEKEEFITMNTSHNIDVDGKQQKRIAELEENVVNLSRLCGEFESERTQLQRDVNKLEHECDSLHKQLDQARAESHKTDTIVLEKAITKNKLCQTEAFRDNTELLTATRNERVQQVDCGTQTEVREHKPNLAIVAPIQHIPTTQPESDEDEYRASQSVSPNSDGLAKTPEPSTSNAHESGTTSLFYINELARKEIENADYRLRMREYECSLRELQWKYNSDKYRLQSRIADLESLNNTFIGQSKHKSGETMPTTTNQLNNINVAYIKNVLNKLLETKEKANKEIMIKALITALNSMQMAS